MRVCCLSAARIVGAAVGCVRLPTTYTSSPPDLADRFNPSTMPTGPCARDRCQRAPGWSCQAQIGTPAMRSCPVNPRVRPLGAQGSRVLRRAWPWALPQAGACQRSGACRGTGVTGGCPKRRQGCAPWPAHRYVPVDTTRNPRRRARGDAPAGSSSGSRGARSRAPSPTVSASSISASAISRRPR